MPTLYRDIVIRQFEASIDTAGRFFRDNADGIARASFQMARRFARGGRLFAFGSGGSATDAQHISVEFVHPVIVGKRALPAVALTNDIATLLGSAARFGLDEIYAHQLQLLGHSDDIAIGLKTVDDDGAVSRGLDAAREAGMLTIEMSGPAQSAARNSDFCFSVPCDDVHAIQEVQETAYHVFWETVHVFFEHPGLLEAAA